MAVVSLQGLGHAGSTTPWSYCVPSTLDTIALLFVANGKLKYYPTSVPVPATIRPPANVAYRELPAQLVDAEVMENVFQWELENGNDPESAWLLAHDVAAARRFLPVADMDLVEQSSPIDWEQLIFGMSVSCRVGLVIFRGWIVSDEEPLAIVLRIDGGFALTYAMASQLAFDTPGRFALND